MAVGIVEVSPRDGLQNERARLETGQKVELIERAVAAGARRIEAASFVHPTLVPAMADAEAVMEQVRIRGEAEPDRHGPRVSYIGLVLNRRGYDRGPSRPGWTRSTWWSPPPTGSRKPTRTRAPRR